MKKNLMVVIFCLLMVGIGVVLQKKIFASQDSIPEALVQRQTKEGSGKFQSAYEANEVNNTITKHRSEIQECYNTYLATNPKVTSGKISLDWYILPNGNVEKAEIVSSDFESKDFGACNTKAIQSWVFPEPPGARKVYISHVFNLKKVEEKLAAKPSK